MSVPTGPAAVTRSAARVLLLNDDDRLLLFRGFDPGDPIRPPRGFNDLERRYVLTSRWWSLPELAATTEVVYPAELAELLPALLAGEVPDPPLVLAG